MQAAAPRDPDPLIWLAHAAAVAPTLRLGTCILIVPQRNPLVLAKELATLDVLSGGRVELGLGVGWMKEEFDAYDVPFRGRGKRMDEQLPIIQKLLAGEVVSADLDRPGVDAHEPDDGAERRRLVS